MGTQHIENPNCGALQLGLLSYHTEKTCVKLIFFYIKVE